ncbi:MAG: hypothetical protein ACI9KE_000488 [Polyangiales bacterium]|jgi:hypothetical protein
MRLLAIILFAACGSRDPETASNAEPASSESSSAEGAPGEAVPVETPMDPAPVPLVDLQSVDDEGLSLQVRAVGDAVELRRNVRIERQSGDTWEAVEAEYKLRVDCEEISGECLALTAGAELSSPQLSTVTGQCGGSELAPGTYRFVVQSCAPEGTRPHEIHSVFTLHP